MRTALLLLAMTTVLAACAGSSGSSGGSAGDGDGADAVQSATTQRAREVIPAVSEALASTSVEAHGQWQSCMAISWRYEAFATVSAPEGETGTQLEQVRGALVDAGWEDTTKVDGHVTVEREGTTVDVQPSPARGPGAWTVSVTSECADYDGEELRRVESDRPRPIDGV